MKHTITAASDLTPRPNWLDRWLTQRVKQRLTTLNYGQLTLIDETGEACFGPANAPLQATITVHDLKLYQRIIARGSVGAAEGYMAGEWSVDNLTNAIRLFARNLSESNHLDSGAARIGALPMRIFHALRRNSRSGSRRNIAAHYDLGNEFYRLFLDSTMMYSCALFAADEEALAAASERKLERICQKLDLKPTDHVLEIGTGWGGFALYAASRYGCHVTTTTISQEQYRYASQRVKEAGLEERVTLLRSDYRDLTGQYDKLVSIEMIEAVGHAYLDTFFEICSRCLKPEGLMALQAITIPDQRYQKALNSTDFIQRYIFPGGCLPSVEALSRSVARASDLRFFHLEDIGPHYATTLRRWRERFMANVEQVRQLGFPESFIRMWEYYLCYCEGGFLERSIGTIQLVLCKPHNRRAPLLGSLVLSEGVQ